MIMIQQLIHLAIAPSYGKSKEAEKGGLYVAKALIKNVYALYVTREHKLDMTLFVPVLQVTWGPPPAKWLIMAGL